MKIHLIFSSLLIHLWIGVMRTKRRDSYVGNSIATPQTNISNSLAESDAANNDVPPKNQTTSTKNPVQQSAYGSLSSISESPQSSAVASTSASRTNLIIDSTDMWIKIN